MAAKQFYDDTPIETADVQRWENAASNKTPFYQIEPTSISESEIKGTIYYKDIESESTSNVKYDILASDYSDGDWCIAVSPNGIYEDVGIFVFANPSGYKDYILLAYVTIANGKFTDFRLAGDKYLISKISAGYATALSNAQSYADEKDTTVLSNAKSYADTGDAKVLSDSMGFTKSYTDGQILDTNVKINNALTGAKAYADGLVADKVPYYQIEPDNASGTLIDGVIYYKNAVDGKLYSAEYKFDSTEHTYADGENCIIPVVDDDGNVTLSLQKNSVISNRMKLAFVTVTDGVFSDFRLVGDGYLEIKISVAEGKAKKYAEDYAKEKDAETLASAQEYAGTKADEAYSAAQRYADNAVSVVQGQLDDKVNATFVNGVVAAHNTSDSAHGALFGSINSALSGISGGLASAVEKGNATADTVALLQKYPCYEYAASGGAVQRFDDVSMIPHTIGITVHGATDENGNSVTNPTVSVYGKNMLYAENGDYYASSNRIKVNVTDGIFTATRMTETVYNNTFGIGGTFTPIISGNYTVKAYGISANTNSNAVSIIVKNKTDDAEIIKNVFIGGTAKTGTLEAGKEYQYFININSANFNTLLPNIGDYITFKVQLEYGDTATDYELVVKPQTVTVPMTFADGEAVKISTFNAVSPTMVIMTSDDNGLISTVDVTYNRDVGKAIAALTQ